MTANTLNRRYARFLSLALILILFLFLSSPATHNQPEDLDPPTTHLFPPLYESYHHRERTLPQHNATTPPQKFLWVANHAHGSGWGNIMQELIFNAHLAYASNRSFVFYNYTWNMNGPDFSDYNGKPIPSRIPLSAIIDGPIVGTPFPKSLLPAPPLAVSREYFLQHCPHPTLIRTSDISPPGQASAATVLARWLDRLNNEDPCVQIVDGPSSGQIFDVWIFSSSLLHDIWPALRLSPVLATFSWSPLVYDAFDANQALITPAPSSLFSFPSLSTLPFIPFLAQHFLFSLLPSWPASSTPATRLEPLPGLLVLHIRHGDFQQHCHHMANCAASFMGFNTLPGLASALGRGDANANTEAHASMDDTGTGVDAFVPPPNDLWGDTSDANRAMYMQRCWLEVARVVERVREVRGDVARERGWGRGRIAGWGRGRGSGLRKVYIMTNALAEWIDELREALMHMDDDNDNDGAWEAVVSSRDMQLGWEQKYIAQAVDMYVAERAQVFIGNGFSSLTSNVVMLRAAKRYPPSSTRFW